MVEDYEAQELEFWRKLEETDMSRSQMLKRSVAAAAGLTVLASPAAALAGLRRAGATPPLKGSAISMKELIAQAKKEGKLNTIALPPDWANYGEIMNAFQKNYGLKITNDNPNGSSADENQAVRTLKGDSRAPDVVDDSPAFAISGTAEGLFGKYFSRNFATIPRAMKDTRGFWTGDYWGAISIGYNASIVKTAPKTWEELLYSDQGQLLWLKGYSHPARFQDLAKRNKIPKALLSALPAASIYAKVKFASSGQQTKAKAVIAAQWPSKMG